MLSHPRRYPRGDGRRLQEWYLRSRRKKGSSLHKIIFVEGLFTVHHIRSILRSGFSARQLKFYRDVASILFFSQLCLHLLLFLRRKIFLHLLTRQIVVVCQQTLILVPQLVELIFNVWHESPSHVPLHHLVHVVAHWIGRRWHDIFHIARVLQREQLVHDRGLHQVQLPCPSLGVVLVVGSLLGIRCNLACWHPDLSDNFCSCGRLCGCKFLYADDDKIFIAVPIK
mmetsp:Transcript_37193/g.97418  ORF Transcript_37193/g.97418 Transcript_37193/m.97418 type:complete len:226 (-) Transcript_37193:615-1292(-)